MFGISASRLALPPLVAAAVLSLLLLAGACGRSGKGLPAQSAENPARSVGQVIAEIEAAPVPEGVAAATFDQLRAELIRVIREEHGDKIAARAPEGPANSVGDLYLYEDLDASYWLSWGYANGGDYDGNSEVNISDLTPVGLYLGAVTTSPNWEEAQAADGDGNGEVNIADITPIGAGFMSKAAGYRAYGGPAPEGPWTPLGETAFSTAVPCGGTKMFRFDLPGHDHSFYQVVPFDDGQTEGVPSEAIEVISKVLIVPFSLNPSSAQISSFPQMQCRVGIDIPECQVAKAEIEEVDGSGNPIAVLGEIVDDGNTSLGDDIAGDNIYNYSQSINSDTQQLRSFRVKLTYNPGEATEHITFSNTQDLLFYQPMTELRAGEIVTQAMDYQNQLDTLAGGTTPEDAAQQVLAMLQADGTIQASGLAESGQGVWWVTTDGIPGAASTFEAGERAGQRDSAVREIRPGVPAGRSVPRSYSDITRQVSREYDPDLNFIGNKKVICLSPYSGDAAFTPDESAEIYANFQALDCPDFEEEWYATTDCTLDRFKTLGGYGVVVVATHGDSYFNGWTGFLSTTWGAGGAGARVAVLTREATSALAVVGHLPDLLAGRALLCGSVFAFTPNFVSHYCSGMPNSVVYVGACRSSFNATMANAFIGAGAATYIGYSDYVDGAFAHQWGRDFFDKLMTGLDTGESYTPGQVETDADPASYDLFGDEYIHILPTLVNGNFEYGLSGWTAAGDARAIGSLGPLSPMDGSWMAIVSTGLGAVSSSDSSLTQRFCVPPTATTLTLWYDVVSEEPHEFIGTQYDDVVELMIGPAGGSPTVFANESINISAWSPIGGIDFAGGDDTTYHTVWRYVSSVDLTSLRGQEADIVIHTYDAGDSAYDTAVIVDNIVVETE